MSKISTELEKAIATATPERLEIVLNTICNRNTEAAVLAPELMLTSSKKRKRYEICDNCNQEFDVNENNDKACQFHPGD